MKHLLLSFLFSLVLFLGQAQSLQPDTIYLDKYRKPLPSKSGASYYSLIRFTGGTNPEAVEEIYYRSGTKASENPYRSLQKKILHGQVRQWHENGQLKSEGYYEQGEQAGPFKAWYENGDLQSTFHVPFGLEGQHLNTTYYPNGQLKRRDVYLGSELAEGACYTASGQDTTYYPFEIMPLFPGGEQEMFKYLGRNIRYPKKASKQRIQGLVIVQYTVSAKGDIIEPRVVKSLSPELDEESLRVVRSMPRWSPGMQDGVRVPVLFTLPIRYTIE